MKSYKNNIMAKAKTEEKNPVDKNKKIRFLLSPAGRFLLPYNVGQTVEMPTNQADELIAAEYAEAVK